MLHSSTRKRMPNLNPFYKNNVNNVVGPEWSLITIFLSFGLQNSEIECPDVDAFFISNLAIRV